MNSRIVYEISRNLQMHSKIQAFQSITKMCLMLLISLSWNRGISRRLLTVHQQCLTFLRNLLTQKLTLLNERLL
ncbi:hypothetical protein FGO68_gene6466 [Halteria grandinella]|uniref:Uncharacterized protein n=1 Tax=Halteria grandinella TaxID=5974 RepID=A0A8J8NTS3_HALGN|nr:hypothetical protein FGO68_gene6466 [Halteria grandinella]